MNHPEVTAVFVYGSLKRGQCREKCWPHAPQRVDEAFTHGSLYDLGPYPAMAEGTDRVEGEVWRFAPEHMPKTLAALDQVEQAAAGEPLYERRIAGCVTTSGESLPAHMYFFAQPNRLNKTQQIQPTAGGCRWPD